MRKFLFGLNSLFNFYRSKKSLPFILPIILGVAYKLNSIALIIIPIQAIKSVSEGKLSTRSSEIFEYLQFPIPANEHIFIFFLILIIISLFTLIYLNKLKEDLIVKVKDKLNNSMVVDAKSSSKKISNNAKLNKKIDNFIKNSENLIFCLTLSLIVIIYDFQIALIIVFGCLLYINILSGQKDKYHISNGEKTYKNNILNYFKFKLNWFNNNKPILKTIISTIVMLLVMSLLYLRTNSSISIIFIFLIRIFQNNLLTSITNLFNKNELPF